MERPTSVSVGYRDYEIVWHVVSALNGNYGIISHHSNRIDIEIQDSVCDVNTVLHEVLHAVVENTGLRETNAVSDTKDEELIVTALSNGLTEVLKRNPELTKWIQKSLKD